MSKLKVVKIVITQRRTVKACLSLYKNAVFVYSHGSMPRLRKRKKHE